MNKFSAVFLLFFISLIWGIGFVAVKDGTENYGVFSFLALRFAIGAIVLLPFALRHFDKKTLLVGAGIGFVLFLAFLLQTAGLKTTTVSKSGLITSLFLPFAILINRLIFGVKVNRFVWFLIPVTLAGLSILTFGSPGGAVLSSKIFPDTAMLFGDFLTVLCAAMFGLHIVLLERFGRNFNASVLAFIQLAAVAICSGMGAPIFETLVWPDKQVWLCIVFCGLFCSALCYLLQTYSQKYISATLTAYVLMCEPVFSVFFGVMLKNDSFSIAQMFGAVIMLGTTVLIIKLPEPDNNSDVNTSQ
jgi:Permeases of the drug/metabolite transporter (DMT) superfamily